MTGDALDAVAAAFVGQGGVGAVTFYGGDEFAEAAEVAGGKVEDFPFPEVFFAVAAVHFGEVGDEEAGLIAAGAGADFEDDGGDGELVSDEEVGDDGFEGGVTLGEEFREFGGGEFGHVFIGAGGEGLGIEVGLLGGLEGAELGELPAEFAVLLGEFGEAQVVGGGIGIVHLGFELLEAGFEAFELGDDGEVGGRDH